MYNAKISIKTIIYFFLMGILDLCVEKSEWSKKKENNLKMGIEIFRKKLWKTKAFNLSILLNKTILMKMLEFHHKNSAL